MCLLLVTKLSSFIWSGISGFIAGKSCLLATKVAVSFLKARPYIKYKSLPSECYINKCIWLMAQVLERKRQTCLALTNI